MKVSNYQFRLKYHTENKSTVRTRRLEYAREYGYKGEDVSPEDMAALEYQDANECHMRELAARIDEGWKTAPVKEALSLPAAAASLDKVEDALVPLMQLHDRMLLLADFAEAKLDAILEKADTSYVCEWAEALLGMVYRHKGRYGRLKKKLSGVIETKLKIQ